MYAKPSVPGGLTAGGVRRPKAAATREEPEGDCNRDSATLAGKGRLRARAADVRGHMSQDIEAQISSGEGESRSALAARDLAAQPSQRSGVCLVQ